MGHEIFKEASVGMDEGPGQQMHTAVVETETATAHKVDIDANLLNTVPQHVQKTEIGSNCRVQKEAPEHAVETADLLLLVSALHN